MFGLFKKQKKEFYFPITTDIHSHILPGIDDGATDVENAITLVKGLMALGINRSVATPHVIGDMYRNTPDTIFTAQELLQKEIEKQQLDFHLASAAEYMLDLHFFELLDNRSLILPIKDKIVLTEFSYSSMPDHIEKMSFNIQTEGLLPILAHPERYGYYHNNYKMFHHLYDLGFKLQVNLLSISGYYGNGVQKAANYILKNNLASFLATDLHHVRHLNALNDAAANGAFLSLKEKEWPQLFPDA